MAALLVGCSLVGYPTAVEEVGRLCEGGDDEDLDGLVDCEETSCAPVCARRWYRPAEEGHASDVPPRPACPTTWRDPCRPPLSPRDVVAEAPEPPPAPRYVDATAPAGGTGTLAAPARSIGEIIALGLTPPVDVFVRPGEYEGSFTLPAGYRVVGAGADRVVLGPTVGPSLLVITAAAGGELGSSISGVRIAGDVLLDPDARLELDRVRLGGRISVSARAELSTIDAELSAVSRPDPGPVLDVGTTGIATLRSTGISAPLDGGVGARVDDGRLVMIESWIELPTVLGITGQAIVLSGAFAELEGEGFGILATEPPPGAMPIFDPGVPLIDLEGGARAHLSDSWLETYGATVLRVVRGSASLERVDVAVLETYFGDGGAERSRPSTVPAAAEPAIVIGPSGEDGRTASLLATALVVAGARDRAIVVSGATSSASLADFEIVDVLDTAEGDASAEDAIAIDVDEGATASLSRGRVLGAGDLALRIGATDAGTVSIVTVSQLDVLGTGGSIRCGDAETSLCDPSLVRSPPRCGSGTDCATTAGILVRPGGQASLLDVYVEGTFGCGLRLDGPRFFAQRLERTALVGGRFGLCVTPPYDVSEILRDVEENEIAGAPLPEGSRRIVFRQNQDDGLGDEAERCLGFTVGCGTDFDDGP